MTTTNQPAEQPQITYDTVACPIYSVQPVDQQDACRLSAGRDRPQIIEILVWPYPESQDARPELRNYYCLNLPQAVARATEIEVRLREQARTAIMIGLRPATSQETNAFFRAMDLLEPKMPEPVNFPVGP